MSQQLNQQGVTIVELLVVMVVSTLMIGIITAFGLNYWSSSASLATSQDSFVTRLNTGDYMRENLDAASGLIIQNNLIDNNVGSVDTSDATGKHWENIHAIPKTITMGPTGTIKPLVYFNRPSINTSKNIVLNGTIAYEDDVILYLNGTTKQLLARTIANSSAPSNRALTTCPKASATNACPADIVIGDNVQSVTTRYFSRSGNTIDYTSVVDPLSSLYIGPDFPTVEVVEFKLQYYKKSRINGGADSINQTVIRVALRNS